MKDLKIPVKYRRPGLYVYCNKCKRYSTAEDGLLKKSPNCDHPPEKQVFKLKVHVAGTRRVCRTKVLNTRDIKEVDKLRTAFIELLEQNNYDLSKINSIDESTGDRNLLTYQMDKYLDFITTGGTYDYEAERKLNNKTVKDYERHFRYFIQSIDGYVNPHKIRVDGITKEHISAFHKYIKKKTPSPKTYNNIMGSLRALYNHLINYERFKIDNLFTEVPHQTVYYDPVIFSKEEFDKVMSSTTYNNGYDNIWKRNLYRDWLPTAFKLGLYTCLRLEELVYLKYSDILNIDGVLLIQAENHKANELLRIKDTKNKRIKRIPVIEELKKVLNEECNYEQNIGSNKFIIAPELTRVTVHGNITKGFTHFKRIAGIDENKCFKDLRKTYITKMESGYGMKLSSIISDHSNDEVVKKHYLAQIEAVMKTQGFKVFP